jgi:hypothetical protein
VPLNWRWTAQRLAISLFLIVHLFMVGVFNLPNCFLRQRLFLVAAHYIIPLGLDQSWGMFAPNPVMHAKTMEVLTVDKNGIQRTFAFPKMTDFTVWQAMPRVRHSKFTSNCGQPMQTAFREFAVRHAIRQLKIPADAFPVEAELLYQTYETPPLGDEPRDPSKPPTPQSLQMYRYPTMAEVTP